MSPYGANGSQLFNVIHWIQCDIFEIIYMTYPPYGQPGSWFLSIWKKTTPGNYLLNSICVLPTFYYSWKLTLILYPLFCTACFCVCTRTSPFLAHLQMTLLIHVNWMTTFNASHFLNSETWYMISVISHQRRLTPVILKRLTPENCQQSVTTLSHLFARMLLSFVTWIWWTFVPYAVEKYWKIHILLGELK